MNHIKSLFCKTFLTSACLLAVTAATPMAQLSFDNITHTVKGNVETWKISKPDVTVPTKRYPIYFKKGDTVEVKAGGCVNVGPALNSVKTECLWRNYVYPKADYGYHWMVAGEKCAVQPMSTQNYGTINIPGVTTGFQPITDIMTHEVVIYGETLYNPRRVWTIGDTGTANDLQLGYIDQVYPSSKYTDNGYDIVSWSSEPVAITSSVCNQCSTLTHAWVEITVTHLSPEITGTPATCSPHAKLTVNYKDVAFQSGMRMGLFAKNEEGSIPKAGSQAINGSEGTLNFTAPAKRGRYVFRIVDAGGKIILSGAGFTVATSSVVAPAASGTSMAADTALSGDHITHTVKNPVVSGTSMPTDTDLSSDHITHTVKGNVVTWKIFKPDVTVPTKRYPIYFKKGDTVEVRAGGCVNVGPDLDSGESESLWRNYVYPKMNLKDKSWTDPQKCALQPMSDQNYGTINIPGVTTGFQPITDIMTHEVVIYGETHYNPRRVWTIGDTGTANDLQLGYIDQIYPNSKYSDNGYDIVPWRNEPVAITSSVCGQCSTLTHAWVEIIVTHFSPEITGTPATCAAHAKLTVNYKDVAFQPGMRMGLYAANEGGANPKAGSTAIDGPSGTLNFTAPAEGGRYVFRIVDEGGKVILSGKTFTVAASISADVPVASGNPVASDTALSGKNERNSGRFGSVDAQNRARELRPKKITQETSCETSILFPDMPGYAIAECVKRFDEAVFLLNGDPESPENPRYEGEKIRVKYEWTGDGPSPSELQVRRTYAKEAKKLGGTVLADRNRFTAFTLGSQGRNAHASVEVFNDGRTVVLTVIEPETPDDAEKAGQ